MIYHEFNLAGQSKPKKCEEAKLNYRVPATDLKIGEHSDKLQFIFIYYKTY